MTVRMILAILFICPNLVDSFTNAMCGNCNDDSQIIGVKKGDKIAMHQPGINTRTPSCIPSRIICRVNDSDSVPSARFRIVYSKCGNFLFRCKNAFPGNPSICRQIHTIQHNLTKIILLLN